MKRYQLMASLEWQLIHTNKRAMTLRTDVHCMGLQIFCDLPALGIDVWLHRHRTEILQGFAAYLEKLPGSIDAVLHMHQQH